jgi:hypothetical protein
MRWAGRGGLLAVAVLALVLSTPSARAARRQVADELRHGLASVAQQMVQCGSPHGL